MEEKIKKRVSLGSGVLAQAMSFTKQVYYNVKHLYMLFTWGKEMELAESSLGNVGTQDSSDTAALGLIKSAQG